MTVPGQPHIAWWVRHYVRTVVVRNPAAADIELCVSELFTNALVHSASGKPSGRVRVAVAQIDDMIHVEVTDDGGTDRIPRVRHAGTQEPAGDDLINGHGLQLVEALAAQLGFERHSDGTTTVWFDFPAAPAPPSPGGEAR